MDNILYFLRHYKDNEEDKYVNVGKIYNKKKAEKVIKDDDGNIIEIICSYDPLSRSGSGTEESLRKHAETSSQIPKNQK